MDIKISPPVNFPLAVTQGGTGVTTSTGTGNTVLSASPTLTGTPVVPTQVSTDNSTAPASTAYVTTAIANAVAGVNPAVAVQAATNAILPNSPTYNNGVAGIDAFITTATLNTSLVVDGITLGLLDRVLVKNESAGLGAAKNGVYYVSQIPTVALPWILIRSLDYDTPSDMNNTGAIPVISGTVNALTQWVQSSQVTTVGTDAVTFTQFSMSPSATGSGLDVRQNTPTLIAPLLGTPTSGTLTNCTGLPAANITAGTMASGMVLVAPALGTVASGNISACTSTSMVMVTPVLGTPTSGTLTNCTALPVSGITSSTSTALGIGSIELGHASDTTIARVSAGVISVEGVTVDTISGANTLTNKTLTSPILTTPTLGTPASGALTNCTSIPVANATGLLPLANGGLNLNLTATGGTSQFVKQNTLGGTPTLTRPAMADLSDLPTIASGTYTPTLTNQTNISASTANTFNYIRIGSQVNVTGVLTLTQTTTNLNSEIQISLPIASTLATFDLLGGTCGTYNETCNIQVTGSTGAGSKARVQWINMAGVASKNLGITFGYIIA